MKNKGGRAVKSSQRGKGALRRDFLQVVAAGDFARLFAGIENVLFFIKDRGGQFMEIVQGPHFGPETAEASFWIGKTDFDLFPPRLANRIRQDDLTVMETGQPMLRVIELLINPVRSSVGWHVTNKYPVFDRKGGVIGVMGTVQRLDDGCAWGASGSRVDELIELIRREPGHDFSAEKLGRLALMSARHLARHFNKILGMSPKEFVTLCRMNRACQFLQTTRKSLAEIALECGFCDQSALSRQCRKTTGLTPLEYRKRFQG